jgi:hypothetical protein
MIRNILFHSIWFKYVFREKRKSFKLKRLKRWHASLLVDYLEKVEIPHAEVKQRLCQGLIVSLTVKPGREEQVHLVIKSLLLQTVVPEKIVLWLASDEFTEANLPKELQQLQQGVFEVAFTDENLRPYNKILPTLRRFPDHRIITADDDILYPHWWVEKLVSDNDAYPDQIICYRAYDMKWTEKALQAYNTWPFCTSEQSSLNYFPTGVSGVLYFPGCFTEEVTNTDAIVKHAPTADDVWLKVQSALKGVLIRQVEPNSQHFPMIPDSQEGALQKTNKHTNDKQLQSLLAHYKLTRSDFEASNSKGVIR